MFSFVIIIFGLNNHHLSYSDYFNMDFNNYYTLYLSSEGQISSRDVEIGFKSLMYLSNLVGINFTEFRTLLGVVGFGLIFNTVRRYSNIPNVVLSIYLIFPFIHDAIQIRNFFASAIVIYSMRFLIETNKRGTWKYLLGITIACLFHISSIFYFVFICAKFIKQKKLFYFVFTVFPLAVIFAYTPLYQFLASLIAYNERIFLYLSRRTTWGLFYVFGILFLFYALYFILNREMNRNITEDISNVSKISAKTNKEEFHSFMLKINTLLLLIAPLLVYDFNFIRLYRNILILNYVVFGDVLILNRKREKKYLYLLLILFSTTLFFILFYGLYASEQILPVFNDNYLFQKIDFW